VSLIGAFCFAGLGGFAGASSVTGLINPLLLRGHGTRLARGISQLQRRQVELIRKCLAALRDQAATEIELTALMQPISDSTGISPHTASGAGFFSHPFGYSGSTIVVGGTSSGAVGGAARNQAISALRGRLQQLRVAVAAYRYMADGCFLLIDDLSNAARASAQWGQTSGQLQVLWTAGLAAFAVFRCCALALQLLVDRAPAGAYRHVQSMAALAEGDSATAAERVAAFFAEDSAQRASYQRAATTVLNAILLLGSIRGFLLIGFRVKRRLARGGASLAGATAPAATNISGRPSSQSGHADEGTTGVAMHMGGAHFVVPGADQIDSAYMESSHHHRLIPHALRRVFSSLRHLVVTPPCDANTLLMLLYAEFFAVIFLGMFVLARLNFPTAARSLLGDVVDALPYRPYHRVHDASYVAFAAVTVAVWAVLQRPSLLLTAVDEDDL
jgi:hypothetical protein